MRYRFTQRFSRQHADAPREIRLAFDRHLDLLLQNLQHPSLRAKKYDEANDIWQARVTRGWRFYFRIEADTYVILSLIPHPK